MAPHLLKRISEAFWGYMSPRKPELRPARSYRSPPRPARYITPQRRVGGWLPATPDETPTGTKRKRGFEIEDERKRRKGVGKEDEVSPMSDEFPTVDVASRDTYGRGPRPIHDRYETIRVASTAHRQWADKDEDDGLSSLDDYDDHIRVADANSVKSESESEDNEDDGLAFLDDYNDRIRVTDANPVQSESESNEEDDVGFLDDYDDELPDHAALFGDEDEVVYDDVESEGSSEQAEGDATIFEPSIFEEAEEDGSILADVRARVGSLDSDFVSRQFLLDRGWPEDSVWLIQRLHQRGHEPIFPTHWLMDFRFLPEGLFLTPNARRPSFINSLRSNDFRATKTLTRLIEMGPKVRDKVTVDKAPEPLILEELTKYMQWADWDADNQFPNYPLIETYWGDVNEDVHAMQDALLHRLAQLYQRWRDASAASSSTTLSTAPAKQQQSKTVPTLYGILVSHTLVGIVTFVPGHGGDSAGYLRSVGVFDFGVSDYDVWNALALALLVVHARDQCLERGCGEARPWMKRRWQRASSADPDA